MKKVFSALLRILLPFLCISLLFIDGFSEEVTIEYDSYEYNQESEIHYYYLPRIEHQGVTTSGESAEYDKKTNIMTINGNVIIYSESMILAAEKAGLDFNTNIYTVYQATFFDKKNLTYGKALKIEQITKDDFVMYDADITTCKPDQKAWILRSRLLVYEVDNFAYARNNSIFLYAFPVFFSPFISWPTTETRTSGFLEPVYSIQTSTNTSRNIGHRLKVPYFWALDKDHDLTITADVIQMRGFGTDLNYQYAFSEGMRGQVIAWYIKETAKKRDLEAENLGRYSIDDDLDENPTRYKYRVDHKQRIPLDGTLTLYQLQNSDNELDKEYSGASYTTTSAFSQGVDVSYPIPNGSFSVNYSNTSDFTETSIYDTSTDTKTHVNPHPAVTVSQQYSQIFDTPLSISFKGDWTNHDRQEGWDGQEAKANTKAGFPFSIDFLNVVPEFQRTYYRYNPNYDYAPGEERNSEIENQLDEFGWKIDQSDIELNFEIFRYFRNKDNEKFGKLSIKPRIIYSEIEDVVQQSPSGFGFISSVTSKRALTYRIDTVYKLKNLETDAVRDFFSLSLIQPYDLNSENCAKSSDDEPEYCVKNHIGGSEVEIGEQRLPLRIEMSLTPVGGIKGSLFFRYDHEENEIIETKIQLSASYYTGSSFFITYNNNTKSYNDLDNKYHPEAQLYSFTKSFLLNNKTSLSIAGKWDQARAKANSKLVDSDRLDRVLTDFSTSLAYNHGCYNVSGSYAEVIETNDNGKEYLDRVVTLTLSIPLVPYASSSNVGGLTYQERYEMDE